MLMMSLCFLMGKYCVQFQRSVGNCYGHCSPSKTKIRSQYTDFKQGRTDTDDIERNGCPEEVVRLERIEKTFKIFPNNREVKLGYIKE